MSHQLQHQSAFKKNYLFCCWCSCACHMCTCEHLRRKEKYTQAWNFLWAEDDDLELLTSWFHIPSTGILHASKGSFLSYFFSCWVRSLGWPHFLLSVLFCWVWEFGLSFISSKFSKDENFHNPFQNNLWFRHISDSNLYFLIFVVSFF